MEHRSGQLGDRNQSRWDSILGAVPRVQSEIALSFSGPEVGTEIDSGAIESPIVRWMLKVATTTDLLFVGRPGK